MCTMVFSNLSISSHNPNCLTTMHNFPRIASQIELITLGADLRLWYPQAQKEIETVCRLEKWDVEYFTGLLAACSPRISVRRSIRQALLYQTGKRYFPNFPSTIRVCVEKWDSQRILTGQKIEAFRKALLGDESAIVVDTHICKAFRIPQASLARKNVLPAVCQRITALADRIDCNPRDTQAQLWGGAFRKYVKRTPAGFPLLAEYKGFKALGYQYPLTGPIDLPKLLRDASQPRLF